MCLKRFYGDKLVQKSLDLSDILRGCEAKLEKNNEELLDKRLKYSTKYICNVFMNITLSKSVWNKTG